MPERRPRILIVDDHELIRVGLKRILLDSAPGALIEEAGSARTALEHLKRGPWHLVILDLSLPDCDGLDVLKSIKARAPSTPILVLTILPEEQVAVRVLRAGADGFLPKSSAARDLDLAAKVVLGGGKYVSPTVAAQLIQGLRGAPDELHTALSDREDQVFRAIARGMTVSEIADTIGLSVKTVSTYRTNTLRKLHLQNNAQLVSYAHRHRLV